MVFPRCGHLSAGICGKGESASTMRAWLERYMAEHGLSKGGPLFTANWFPASLRRHGSAIAYPAMAG
jgi:hypothetical protein